MSDALDMVRQRALDKMRERDYARPAPTSRADSVCMCCYDGPNRVYRCRGCIAGFGPDVESLQVVIRHSPYDVRRP